MECPDKVRRRLCWDLRVGDYDRNPSLVPRGSVPLNGSQCPHWWFYVPFMCRTRDGTCAAGSVVVPEG